MSLPDNPKSCMTCVHFHPTTKILWIIPIGLKHPMCGLSGTTMAKWHSLRSSAVRPTRATRTIAAQRPSSTCQLGSTLHGLIQGRLRRSFAIIVKEDKTLRASREWLD
jgi:hypothetical protein